MRDDCVHLGSDEGHVHEGGSEPAGEEAAWDGEAAEGEDDPQCHATKGRGARQNKNDHRS